MSPFIKKLPPVAVGSAMADMAMLLLVFFMATTTTEPPKGVEVELPKGKTQGAEQDSLYLSIDKNGVVYFDGEPVDTAALKNNLVNRQGEKNKLVAITADKNLSYEAVNNVLEILREKDFLNIMFMAQSKDAPESLP